MGGAGGEWFFFFRNCVGGEGEKVGRAGLRIKMRRMGGGGVEGSAI